MQIRPTAFTIGLIIHFSIALFCVYTEFGIDSFYLFKKGNIPCVDIAFLSPIQFGLSIVPLRAAHIGDTLFICCQLVPPAYA